MSSPDPEALDSLDAVRELPWAPPLNAAPGTRRQAAGWALAAFLLALFPAVLWIRVWAIPVPFGDQWDGELLPHYLPVQSGEFTSARLFEPYNGINLKVTKRWLDQLLLLFNQGKWDPLLQMLSGGLIFAGAMAVMAWVCRRHGGRSCAVALTAWLATLAWIPLHWENVIWGFQTAIHLYVLFTMIAFAAAAVGSSRGLWLAVPGIALASLSFGAAFLTGLCLIFVLMLMPAQRQAPSGMIACIAVTLGAVALHGWIILSNSGADIRPPMDAGLVLRALAWPLSTHAPLAAALILPILIHLIWCLCRRGAATTLSGSRLVAVRLLTMLWLWSVAQQMLVRLLRDGTSSRHMELLWFGWLAPLLIGVILTTRGSCQKDRVHGTLLVVFGALLSFGAFASKGRTLEQDLNLWARSQTVEFLALHEARTGDGPTDILSRHDAHLDTLNRYILVNYAFELVNHPQAVDLLPNYFSDPEYHQRLMNQLSLPQRDRITLAERPAHETKTSNVAWRLATASPGLISLLLLAAAIPAIAILHLARRKTAGI